LAPCLLGIEEEEEELPYNTRLIITITLVKDHSRKAR
jgi:hypothetical protein